MRIAIDATALYGRYGGVEYSVWNLLRALHAEDSESGNEYYVYIPRDGPPRERLKTFGARWHWIRLPFDGEEKLRRIFWQQRIFPAQLRQNRYDLLHAPTYVAPLAASIPTVLTVYDLIALSHPQFATALNRLHYGVMLPRSIARAARVLAPTPAVANEIKSRFPAARVRVVPLGVEPIFLQTPDATVMAQVRAHHNLPEKYLLFVGNFEPKKNLQTLLRAIELLPGAPPLVIAGGNRAWPECVLASTPSTRQIGYVPRAELPALYSGCEVFIFPSLAEGFGLPVLEALAGGAPVVTSPAVPLPHLEEAAIICDPRDAAALAAGIQRVLHDPEEAARLKMAGKAYAQPFTWRRAARETLAVYREVV